MRAMLVGLSSLLLAGSARADMVDDDGEKGLALSIRVDGEVPAGKTLVLANTSDGADIVKVGQVQTVAWRVFDGDLQLRMIDSKKIAAIEAARAGPDRDKVPPLLRGAAGCGPSFQGPGTISDRSPADEVRWTFHVSFADGSCDAKLTATEYFDRTGKAVDPTATVPTATDVRAPVRPPGPVKPAADPPASATKPEAPASACHISATTAAAPGLLPALLLLGRRRPRRT